MAKDKKKADALKDLFPGRTVTISGVDVSVEPLGFRHIRKFSDAISKIMPTVVTILGDTKSTDDNWMSKLGTALAPFLMTDLLDLVNDCCDVDLNSLPHYHIPPIMDAWLQESFGDEGKMKPWKNLFQTILERFVTSQGSILPASSISSSAPDTTNAQ